MMRNNIHLISGSMGIPFILFAVIAFFLSRTYQDMPAILFASLGFLAIAVILLVTCYITRPGKDELTWDKVEGF